MADSVLCIGTSNPKLPALLAKLGYEVLAFKDGLNISALPSREVVDLIIFENAHELTFEEARGLLLSQPATRHAALIYLSADAEELAAVTERPLAGVEVLAADVSLGILASRIATLLRLRKIKGLDESASSLAEMNAALRDLNAHYQKELEEAQQIQASLLPQELLSDPRFDVAVYYKPLEEVGGDWYNYRVEPSGKISAQVADVSGHGLAAAFLGSMAKLGFSAVTEELPHALFEGMNSLLTPQMPSGRFVTMCGFLFDPETGHVDFARAGHQPALILRAATGTIDQLLGEGFAMGFFEESEYSHEQTDLEPGDVFVVFSDGLVEAQNRDSVTWGLEGLSASMQAAPKGLPAQAMVDKIMADFDAFMDGRVLKDDITVLALRRIS